MSVSLDHKKALLRKSASGQRPPFPGHTYPAATVIGMPSAVKRFRTATRIWTSATWQSKSRDISRCPSSFTQLIQSPGQRSPGPLPGPRHISTMLRLWCPLQFRQSVRPKCFDARRISLRARAPAVSGFHGRAFRRCGSEEVQQKVRGTFCPTTRRRAAGRDGIMAAARVVGTVCRDGGNLLVRRDLGEQVRQHPSPVRPDATASHCISGSDQTVSEPRRLSASLAAALGPVARNGSLATPVGRLVLGLRRSAHGRQLSCRIRAVNPRPHLRNKPVGHDPARASSLCAKVEFGCERMLRRGSNGCLRQVRSRPPAKCREV